MTIKYMTKCFLDTIIIKTNQGNTNNKPKLNNKNICTKEYWVCT